ncbi:MAG: SDR family oxidoreductase [Opitutales bacterium]
MNWPTPGILARSCKRVILTGASGLVGAACLRHLIASGHEVVAIHHKHPPALPAGWPNDGSRLLCQDLTDLDALTSRVLEEFPDLILNAAAISQPAEVEADPVLAEKINVALPRRLAQLANHLSARLFHLSTDMVFDGQSGPFRSTDRPNPTNLYGQTKLLAEREVLREGAAHSLVLRITLVTGNSPGGRRSVHEKLFEAWSQGKTAQLFTDEQRQPVSADNVAELLTELIDRPNLSGLFHWAGAETLSRFAIGQRIVQHFGLSESLIAPVELKAIPECANRPADLRLELQPLLSKIKVRPADFGEQLAAMSVPDPFLPWYQAQAPADNGPDRSGAPPLRRFVRGQDF